MTNDSIYRSQLNNTLPTMGNATQPVAGVGTNPFALGHLVANRYYNDAANTRLLDAFTMNQAAVRGHQLDLASMAGRNNGLNVIAELMKGGNAGFPMLGRNENADVLQRVFDLAGVGQVPIQHRAGVSNRNTLDQQDLVNQQAAAVKDTATGASNAPPSSPVTLPIAGQRYTIDPNDILTLNKQRTSGKGPQIKTTHGADGKVIETSRPATTDEIENLLAERDRTIGQIPTQPLGTTQDAVMRQTVADISDSIAQNPNWTVIDNDNIDPNTGGVLIRVKDSQTGSIRIFRLDQAAPGQRPVLSESTDQGLTWVQR